MAELISRAQFAELTAPLLGLPVSRAWRGYGSAVFLELGAMSEYEGTGNPRGEATVMVEWDWRVEGTRSIRFGSSSGDRKLNRGIAALAGPAVVSIAVEGRLPELAVTLADGRELRSCAAVEGQPRWTVFLLDRSWVCVERGRLYRDRSRE
jgi:hypothetical protein